MRRTHTIKQPGSTQHTALTTGNSHHQTHHNNMLCGPYSAVLICPIRACQPHNSPRHGCHADACLRGMRLVQSASATQAPKARPLEVQCASPSQASAVLFLSAIRIPGRLHTTGTYLVMHLHAGSAPASTASVGQHPSVGQHKPAVRQSVRRTSQSISYSSVPTRPCANTNASYAIFCALAALHATPRRLHGKNSN